MNEVQQILDYNLNVYSSVPGDGSAGAPAVTAAPSARSPGGSRCRYRRDKLRAPRAAAACPGSTLPRADLRCTSAARGAAGARRSCGRRRSSPGCTGGIRRQPDLHLLGHQVQVHLVHHQVDDLDQVVVGERA